MSLGHEAATPPSIFPAVASSQAALWRESQLQAGSLEGFSGTSLSLIVASCGSPESGLSVEGPVA